MKLPQKVNLILLWMVQKLHLQEGVYYIGSNETLPPPLTPEEEQLLLSKMEQDGATDVYKRQYLKNVFNMKYGYKKYTENFSKRCKRMGKVLVIGAARSGLAAAEFLAKQGEDVYKRQAVYLYSKFGLSNQSK